ncbi:anti-sigma factor [Actinoplanes regularis]|uniref:anti-sigma factor n=1 Tax=Actinoplanes regularis TaxID=52697 RepID=UPI002553D710|nr:anti-sigma factor [Actinoplanes regularis]
MTTEIHSLIGAYALDALDDLERAAFDRHLRECATCRAEADELHEAANHLADGAWSVPPPRLRDNVLAAIAQTPQLAPAAAPRPRVRARSPHRLRWVAAAAVVLAAVGAGTIVHTIEDQRVRREQALAAILTAPDVIWHEESLASGGRVRVATSERRDAGVIMLDADQAPTAGKVYQLWTIRSGVPSSAGALDEGQSVSTRIVDDLSTADAVGVTVETAPESKTPTAPLDAQVNLA